MARTSEEIINGALPLPETTAPSATTGCGKIYVKASDHNLYYKDASGNEIQITPTGTGTVTSVSVTTANGVSGSVATATTTPAITLTLGAITPSTVNGLTFTAATNGFTIAGGTTPKTLTLLKAMSFSAADDTGVYTFPTGTKTLLATDGVAAKATILETTRAIYGNNFNGSAALAGIIASTYGGTGNGFTNFTGPTTSEKTFTLPDANTTIAGIATTQTLTNKRNTPRISSQASTSSLTPEIDTYDYFEITALAAALNMANHSTSTMTGGEKIIIAITGDATPRALSYGTDYVAKGGVALPTTTVASKTTTLGFIYNAGLAKWNLMAVAQEA